MHNLCIVCVLFMLAEKQKEKIVTLYNKEGGIVNIS